MADEWRDELRRRLRAMRDPDQRAERMRQYKQAQRAERAAQRKAAAERQPYVADMTAAQAYLDTAQRRFDDYDGNNPNKHPRRSAARTPDPRRHHLRLATARHHSDATAARADPQAKTQPDPRPNLSQRKQPRRGSARRQALPPPLR